MVEKFDEISEFVVRRDPWVVIVSESHLVDESEEEMVGIEGYSSFSCTSVSRHTGGVMIYVRDDLCGVEIGSRVVQRKWWNLAVRVKLGGDRWGTVMGCYRSPSGIKDEFL